MKNKANQCWVLVAAVNAHTKAILSVEPIPSALLMRVLTVCASTVACPPDQPVVEASDRPPDADRHQRNRDGCAAFRA